MLPTTGHFISINCPFYENCICERPYCHFKHSKKENVKDENNLISELVSKAVHKVLNTSLSPTLYNTDITNDKELEKEPSLPSTTQKVTYNPTPISELNKYKSSKDSDGDKKSKRHIPISYTPQRPQKHSHALPQYQSSTLLPNHINNSKGNSQNSTSKTEEVSYIPSSIKSLNAKYAIEGQSNATDVTKSEGESQEDVFLCPKAESNSYSPQVTHPIPEYKPTVTSKTDGANLNEYVPTVLNSSEKILDAELNNTNEDFLSDILDNNSLFETLKYDVNKPAIPETPVSVEKASSKKSDSSSKSSSKSSDKSKSHRHSSDKHRSASKDSKSNKDKVSKSDKDRKKNHHKSSSRESKSRHSSSRSKREHSGERSSEHKSKHQKLNHRSEKIEPPEKQDLADKPKASSDSDDFAAMGPEFYLSDSDFDDPSSTLEECKRIFEEYEPQKIEKLPERKVIEKEEESSTYIANKKRVAHENSTMVSREPVVKIKKTSPAEIMQKRYKQTQPTLPTTEEVIQSSTTEQLKLLNPAKKRIAHVPNVNSMLSAKKLIEDKVTKPMENKTLSRTVQKGSKRTAHTPDNVLADIPNVLQSEGSKFPINVRMKYLQLLIKECLKLYAEKEDIYQRALNEEVMCYTKCSHLNTYRNSTMLAVNRLRRESETGTAGGQCGQLIAGRDATSEFEGMKLYENLSKWILTKEQLEKNGFPFPSANKGKAIFLDGKDAPPSKVNTETCSRCSKEFITNEGVPVYKDECIYHPAGRYVFRGESRHHCCRGSSSSTGCCVASCHVFEIKDRNRMSGFVQTLPPDNPNDSKHYTIFALDCEMLYTTRGMELARITVVDMKSTVVFERLVRPCGKILDCNTRYSGLTPEMMDTADVSITDVQAALLHKFNSKTILIGHSLESDFKAMRFIHDTVIDTSVLFPHKLGYPYKRGLRALASDILKKIIQNSEQGHDSAEDAITCVELVLWKLKEELKTR